MTIEEIFGEEREQLVWVAINTCVQELIETIDGSQSKGGPATILKVKIAKRMKMTNCSSSTSKSELKKYLVEETEDTKNKIDILGWWKINANRFSVLGHMAHDVLAIPISTVAAESAFSTNGRILDNFCTFLTPFMLECLVCTQDWLRRTTPIDIKESIEELATIEKGIIFLIFPACLHLHIRCIYIKNY
jgi:hypothetical protein